MNYNGIIVGAAVFLSIGICHPAVIKMEYHLGKQRWWIWLVAGLGFSTLSLFVQDDIVSTIMAVSPSPACGPSTKCSCRKSGCFAAGSRKTLPATTTTRLAGKK